MHHHETDSRRTNPGWPDLFLIGFGFVLVMETKSQNEPFIAPTVNRKGERLPGQLDWLESFATTGVPTYVVRPRRPDARHPDLIDEIEEIGYDDALELLNECRTIGLSG